MTARIMIFVAIFSISLFVVVLELVRRKHLREKYALIWLFTSLGLIVLSFSGKFLDQISALVGIAYPPTLVFLIGSLFLLLLTLSLSVIVSHQTTRIIKLVQEIGLLEERIRKLESDKSAKDKPVDS